MWSKGQEVSCCRALKPAGRPLPHCRGGNGPPSATRRLRGGGAVVDSKNIVCHVNSSACRVYVTSFYKYNFHQLLQATFSRPYSCTFSYINAYIHLWTHSDVYILHLHSSVDVQRSLQCYSYIFAVIFVYIFVQPRLHSSVDAQQCLYSTPILTCACGCTAVSTMLQLHFRGHFRVHFRTSTPTFICGRTCLCSLHSTLQRPITCLVFKVAKSAWLHFTHQTEISLFTTFYIYI